MRKFCVKRCTFLVELRSQKYTLNAEKSYFAEVWGAKAIIHDHVLVRVEGLEPPRQRRLDLNQVRLPIPPHTQWGWSICGSGEGQ